MKFDNYLLKIENLDKRRSREEICLHGVSLIIKEVYLDLKKFYHRKLIKKIFNSLRAPYQTLYSWISRSNPIPISKAHRLLKLWEETCGKSKEEFIDKWNLLYKINQGYSQCAERKITLPKEFNEDLAYIIGFFQGDGYLCKEKVNKFQEYSLHFYEASKEVIDSINKIINNEFGIYGEVYFQDDGIGKWYTLRICSKPVYLFFKNVLNIKPGRKTRNVLVPQIIKDSNNPVQLSFIRGFFDAEGGVGEAKKNPWLEIGQASKEKPCEILCWIKDKLDENGITLSEPQRSKNYEFFRIRTAKRETIKKFFEIVSSDHPKKVIKFNTIINKNARS